MELVELALAMRALALRSWAWIWRHSHAIHLNSYRLTGRSH